MSTTPESTLSRYEISVMIIVGQVPNLSDHLHDECPSYPIEYAGTNVYARHQTIKPREIKVVIRKVAYYRDASPDILAVAGWELCEANDFHDMHTVRG